MSDITDQDGNDKRGKKPQPKLVHNQPKPNGHDKDELVDIVCAKVKRRISDMAKDDNKAEIIIKCLKDLGIDLKYNLFSDQLFVNGLNKPDCSAEWDGQLGIQAILEMRMRLDEIKPGFCPSTGRLKEVVNTEAFRNTYHPVRDYLKALPWDGTKRIETLFSQYFGAEDSEYMHAISKLFMLAGVTRIMEPGCKFDYVVTLIGDQGLGKSSGVAALCPHPKWFSDQFPALAMSSHPGRDCLEHFRGRWIIEWGEMAGLRKSEAEQVKSLLSRQTDRGRPAYAEYVIDCERQCVIIASTNREDCLHDETGNRRFLIVRCEQTVLFKDIARDRDQLWAEAYQYYLGGERPVLDPAFYQAAAAEQQASLNGGPYGEYFGCLASLSEGIVEAAHAKNFMKGLIDRWDDDKSPRFISKAMASHGFQSKRYGPRDKRLKKDASIYVKGDPSIPMTKLPIIKLSDEGALL